MRLKKSDYVFEHDNMRASLAQSLENVNQSPERGRFLSTQTGPSPGNRKIVAGERRSEQVARRKVIRVELVYVSKLEMIRSEVPLIHHLLVGQEVRILDVDRLRGALDRDVEEHLREGRRVAP